MTVLKGTSPSIATALVMAGVERCMWSMVGAKALAAMPAHGDMAVG